MGKSPQHGRSVALVLSRETGLVSPQFHVAFDPSFRTVKDTTKKSQWQLKAGFVVQPSMLKERTRGTAGTTRDGSSSKTSANSKGAKTTRKRKSQEVIDDSGEGDPETLNKRAPAAAVGDQQLGTPKLTHAHGGTIELADRSSGPRRLSNRKANPSPGERLKAMMTELVECTQSDITGEIFAYSAMFPDQEHDHIDPYLV